MAADLDLARCFATTSARLLDRHRLGLLSGTSTGAQALAALAAYANPDGGYGWGLEPDLRSPESQPVGALHAFEVFEAVGLEAERPAVALCDWLGATSLADGGLPFALPVGDPTGSAPFWVAADPHLASLHVTVMLAGIAHRTAARVPALAAHPWLAEATAHGLRRLAAGEQPASAHERCFVLQFLDALTDVPAHADQASDLLADQLRSVPADGRLPVEGGETGEALDLLTVSPRPGRPLRAALAAEVVEAALDRLEDEQGDDGGWGVDFALRTPAAALEWPGMATVEAVATLRAHGRC